MNHQELLDRNTFNNMLIAVLAHDLRQPFASIVMTTDMIMHTQRSLTLEEMQLIFNDLRDTATKSLELLDGLMYWVKSKREGFAYQTQPLLLNDMINEANGLFIYEQQKKKIDFLNNVSERELIYAHKQMLQFITRNILNNATKYSPSDGKISVSSHTDNGWVTVTFTDQGNGMTPKQIKKLFNITETAYLIDGHIDGAGIALIICQDMIKLMKGKLWAESISGRGATFCYSLPIQEKN